MDIIFEHLTHIARSRYYAMLVLSVVITTVAVGGYTVYDLLQKNDLEKTIEKLTEPGAWGLSTQAQVINLNIELEAIKEAIKKVKPEDIAWNIEIEALKKQTNNLVERITGLENALLNTPTKALAVPLLRKEVNSLEKVVALSRIELERVYTILLWGCGLMITIALGTFGFVFSNRSQNGNP